MKILLAEDEREIRELITLGLKLNGMEVHSVADGRAAVEEAVTGQFAMILLDMNMPHLDGAKAAEAIRSIDGYAETPILFLSGDDDVANLDFSHSASLAKPFTIRELTQRVRSLADSETSDETA